MILLIDLGNTRLKWARLERGELTGTGAFVHRGADLSGLLIGEFTQFPVPHRILVANVAGDEAGRAVDGWAGERWDLAPEFLESQGSAFGVVNAYAEPARLGVARWLGLMAARRMVGDAVCVIGCGSAWTADVLDTQGRHQGGAIAPGTMLMQKALLTDTAGVRFGEAAGRPALGRNTQECVANGTLLAAAGFVERMVVMSRELLGDQTVCVLTGGDAARLEPLLPFACRLEPDLVLKGMALVAGEEA